MKLKDVLWLDQYNRQISSDVNQEKKILKGSKHKLLISEMKNELSLLIIQTLKEWLKNIISNNSPGCPVVRNLPCSVGNVG